MGESAVTDVSELVEVVSLLSIDTVRLIAERAEDISSDDPSGMSITPIYSLGVNLRDDHAGFRVRFETSIDMPVGAIRCDMLAEYELRSGLIGPRSTEALAEFVNGVALMHVLPYTRQGIADLTARVFGTPLLMPIIQRGSITFELTLDDDAFNRPTDPPA